MIITFDTAKLAYTKGYFENQPHQYSIEESTYGHLQYSSPLDSATIQHDINRIFAPNQSDLQKWLREKHNIDVFSYLIEMISNRGQIQQKIEDKEYAFRIYQDGIDTYIDISLHNLTYETALEYGLQEALKLIEL